MHEEKDISYRDDIVIFGEVLSKSSHNIKNIKNYRKIHNDILRKNEALPYSTECTHQQGYVKTIDNSQPIVDHFSQQKVRLNLQNMSVRRVSVTAGHSRRKRNQDTLQQHARTLNVSNHITIRERSSSKNKDSLQVKYKSVERKHHKGPLKDKYLISWLNSILMEACQDEKFDMTLENPALKKYALDENSLRSKGIKPENLTRIYKSLFVYSLGFNDLLKQVCDKNMNLRKTIWKVFAILLEYCAQGQFQSMLAQIERDKLQKIQTLKDEILKRQKIIENNQQINEKKNVKIYKQIKQLREQNEVLMKEKKILLEEFKQAEQAFNQEVTLRLKYQNKINEIHGVYAEIENKHMRLQNDHQVVVKQVQRLRIQTSEQAKNIIDMKKDIEQKDLQIKLLQKDLKFKFELIGQMEVKKHGDANQNIEHSNMIKNLKSILQEKNRQIIQLNLIVSNTNLLLKTQNEDHHRTQNELSGALQQNSKLHSTIQEQVKDLNDLLLQKRNFAFRTSSIQAEVAILEQKIEEKNIQIKEMKERELNSREQAASAKQDYENEMRLRVHVEQDLRVCLENIKQMKKAKNEIQQENNERKRKMELVDEIIDRKDKELKVQRMQLDFQQFKLNENSDLIKNLQSKINTLNQKIMTNQEVFDKKIKNLKYEKDCMEKQCIQFQNAKKVLQLERDRFAKLFEDIDSSYKNEKFERTNLKIFYENSLNSGQEKNEEIKKLDIKISELNVEIFDLKRKVKNLQFVLVEKQKQFNKDRQFWSQQRDHLMHENRERSQYIHPMVFEDIFENYRISSDNFLRLKKQSASKITNLSDKLSNLELEIRLKTENYEKTLEKKQKSYASVLQRKQNEIQYQAEKNSKLKQRNDELEAKIEKYQQRQKAVERQQKYLKQINEKKEQIESLVADLQRAHDANRALRQSYLNYESSVKNKEETIKALLQEKQKFQLQYEQNMQEKQREIKSKEEVIKQLIQEKEDKNRQEKQLNNQKQEKEKDQQRKMSGRPKNENDTLSGKNKNDHQNRRESLHSSDSKRNDFARKYKGAYIYYAK